MKNINKYIGIPHVFAGYDLNGADCVGLVRKFYEDHGWIPIDDGRPFAKDWYIHEPNRMVRFFLKNFDKVDDYHLLEYGDIVYFRVKGEGHVGIYIPEGRVLQTFPPANSFTPSYSCLEKMKNIMPFFVCGFKRR